ERARQLTWTEVDGVPCVRMEDDSDRLLAGLLFRVGYADETVRLGGVTHLVEHLALPVGPIAGADFNGTVDMLTTVMWVAGHRDETLDAIAAVARRLTDPPPAKLDRDRSTLPPAAE